MCVLGLRLAYIAFQVQLLHREPLEPLKEEKVDINNYEVACISFFNFKAARVIYDVGAVI